MKATPSHPQRGKENFVCLFGNDCLFENMILLKKGVRLIIIKPVNNKKATQEKGDDWVCTRIGGNTI
ncbi:MAG: hypothetical protein PHD43_11150 [Methylococcales bacterium]|nr:hypothetical protein [Methylococcales bacterium]